VSRCLCALVWALLVVPLSAGTVTVDFTPREDGLISVPSFLTFLGNTRGGVFSNSTSTPQTMEFIELHFRAGDAPLTFTADIFAEAMLSPGCDVTVAGGAPQFTCGDSDGNFTITLTAPFQDDPHGPNYGRVWLDNVVISGDDVSADDLVWVRTTVPEPSSFALLALGAVAIAVMRRRTARSRDP
jgi:hypothetical protein